MICFPPEHVFCLLSMTIIYNRCIRLRLCCNQMFVLQVVLIENDIDARPFSSQVLACLPPLPWSVSSADLANSIRQDLRHLRVFSVDPPGMKLMDVSDLLFCLHPLLSK